MDIYHNVTRVTGRGREAAGCLARLLTRAARQIVAIIAVCWVCPWAAAQQAVNTPSAAQPSTGVTLLQPMFHYYSFRSDPTGQDRDIDQFSPMLMLQYGLTSNTALMLIVPIESRDQENGLAGTTDRDSGLGDIHLEAKIRFYKNDLGPIDTRRAAALIGLDVPGSTEPFGTDSFDPTVGLAWTSITQRHGVNAAWRWKFTTNDSHNVVLPGDALADLMNYDFAYVYRADPAVFGDNSAATYLMVELNGLYETNGDHEVFLAPGVMYEGLLWAWEASVQLPVVQQIDHRPETNYIITAGVRFLF